LLDLDVAEVAGVDVEVVAEMVVVPAAEAQAQVVEVPVVDPALDPAELYRRTPHVMSGQHLLPQVQRVRGSTCCLRCSESARRTVTSTSSKNRSNTRYR